MEGKFDQNGFLYIKRSRGVVIQTCPYSNDACGDWCPLMVTDDAGLYTKACNGVIVHLVEKAQ